MVVVRPPGLLMMQFEEKGSTGAFSSRSRSLNDSVDAAVVGIFVQCVQDFVGSREAFPQMSRPSIADCSSGNHFSCRGEKTVQTRRCGVEEKPVFRVTGNCVGDALPFLERERMSVLDFPQQHRTIAAVRIMAVHALSFDCRPMLNQLRGFLVTCETDPPLGHRQHHRCHVALRPRHMANRAGRRHHGMNGRPTDLVRMARRAIGILRQSPGMLDSISSRRPQQ